MNIYCPNTNTNNCELNGNAELSYSSIHAIYGFNQIIKDPILHMYATTIHCIRNSTQQFCQSNHEGTYCLYPSTICNQDITTSISPLYLIGTTTTSTDSETKSDTETVNSTIDLTENDGNLELNDVNTWEYIGYYIVLGLLLIPSILIIAGIIYNTRFKGSDHPKYASILKSMAHVADLYTDIVFCVLLYFKRSMLLYPAAAFTFSAHILSNCAGLYFIHKWRKQKMEFIHRYDNLLIALSVLGGFYPSVELLSCKLFYIGPLSMHLSIDERYRIQQLRFCNDILLENIPMMIFQVLSVISTKIDSITVTAFMFSSISLMIGLLTLISRSCSGKCDDSFYNKRETERLRYRVYVKSSKIRSNHIYSHQLFAKCLSYATEISDGRIETTQIRQILNGISCDVEIVCDISSDDEHQNIEQIMNQIGVDNSSLFDNFKQCLLEKLYIEDDEDFRIICIKGKRNELTDSIIIQTNSSGEFSPFVQVRNDSINDEMECIQIQHSVTI